MSYALYVVCSLCLMLFMSYVLYVLCSLCLMFFMSYEYLVLSCPRLPFTALWGDLVFCPWSYVLWLSSRATAGVMAFMSSELLFNRLRSLMEFRILLSSYGISRAMLGVQSNPTSH